MKSFQKTFKRTEKKYLVDGGRYRELVRLLDGLVEPDQYGRTEILNIYYDTPDFRLIRRSLEKPEYKEKLRLRTYGTPSAGTSAFVELKKKYKGVVYKRRIDMPYRDALRYLNTGVFMSALNQTAGNEKQIFREIEYFRSVYPDIGPAMAISYDRVAVNWTAGPGVRITSDTNIRYRQDRLDLKYGSCGVPLLGPDMHLLEIKLNGGMPTELARILSELEIFPASMSKYGKAYQTVSQKGMEHYGQHLIQYDHGERYSDSGRVSYRNGLFGGAWAGNSAAL